MSIVVFKLGGSLLNLPGLAERVRRVLELRPGTQKLLVVGGGPTTDLVREWDRLHHLGNEGAHWLAVASLALNEALLAELLAEAVVVPDRSGVTAAWRAGQVPILSSLPFLRAEEPVSALDLPHNWESTSDSIAAWIAACWPADELVLIKSADWDAPQQSGSTRPQSGSPSLVDANFPNIARHVPRVSMVNCRAKELAAVPFSGKVSEML